MANTHLTRTSGTSTNTDIFTISTWVKRSELDDNDFFVYATGGNSDDNWFQVGFANDNKFIISAYNTVWLKTNRVFRDVNAWYHIVIKADSPQGTASNRLKLYVNGVEETSFTTDNRSSISQGQTWGWNKNSIVHYIGSKAGSNYFDGCLSHFHFSDGYAYDASTFGSTDSTTGEWQINTSPSFTLGTNGFTILKDGNTITDQSTNSNNWTLAGGTLTKTEDCPSNVFATLNTLNLQTSSPPTIIKGNNTISAIGDNDNVSTTLGGEFKWYYEAKCVQSPDGSNGYGLGVGACHIDTFSKSGWSAGNRGNFVYSEAKWYSNSLVGAGRFVQGNGNEVTTGLTQPTAGDIIGCACDAANGKVYIHINGTYLTSGDPVNGTGFIGGTTGKSGMWFPFFSPDGTDYGTLDINFGNGYFGSTQISSAGTNASGIGIFEYDVPTGYTALSTKGLNL